MAPSQLARHAGRGFIAAIIDRRGGRRRPMPAAPLAGQAGGPAVRALGHAARVVQPVADQHPRAGADQGQAARRLLGDRSAGQDLLKWRAIYRFHLGTEDQAPDPAIEMHESAGNRTRQSPPREWAWLVGTVASIARAAGNAGNAVSANPLHECSAKVVANPRN